jgi:hypothetical protein
MFENSLFPQFASALRPQTAALFVMLLLVIGIYVFYLPQ